MQANAIESERKSGRRLMRPALFILCLAASAFVAGALIFCRPLLLLRGASPRVSAGKWLESNLAFRRTVAIESRDVAAWIAAGRSPVTLKKIERADASLLRAQNCDYFLRVSPVGSVDGFELLRAWAPLGASRALTFPPPAVELYGPARAENPSDIEVELPQPLLVEESCSREINGRIVFPVGRRLGAAAGFMVDTRGCVIAVGGGAPLRGPVYLVLNTAERAAEVIVRGFGVSRRVRLDPYDAAVVPLKRPSWHPQTRHFEEIVLSTERVEGVLYVPCFARVAFSHSEAARACLELGRESAFFNSFPDEPFPGSCNKATAYIIATRVGRWDLAESLESEAEEAEKRLEDIVENGLGGSLINGNSAHYYEELAKVRVGELKKTVLRETPAGDAGLYSGVLDVPALLARGVYEMRGEFMAVPGHGGEPLKIDFFCPGFSGGQSVSFESSGEGKWIPFTMELIAALETQPRLTVRSGRPLTVLFRNVELRWSLKSAVSAVLDDLRAARVSRAIAAGSHEEASKILSKLDPDAGHWNELEIRRLNLAYWRGTKDRVMAPYSAWMLLTLAPGHYDSLVALGEMNPAFRAKAEKLAGNLKTPVDFGSIIRLVGFGMNSNRVHCVWEAARNPTPPLAVNFWIRRHGKWRRRQSSPLPEGRAPARGERLAFEAELGDCFSSLAPSEIAIGVETVAEWHPGIVPASARPEGVVTFEELSRVSL